MNQATQQLDSLSLFCLNIRSVRKHFDELVVYLNNSSTKYNVIVLTEVWAKKEEECRYQIPGYCTLLQDRPDNAAGGVMVLVDSDLPCSHNLILLQTAEIVHISVALYFNNAKFNLRIYGIYRQCRYTFSSFKPDFENILKECNDPTIIVGDLNVCLLKETGSGREYLNLVSAYGFESKINSPTRIFNNSVSLLDHVLVRCSKRLNFECNVVELGITDHYALDVAMTGIRNANSSIKFSKVVDYKLLRRQLIVADWSSVYNTRDVNKCVENFYTTYNNCYENSCSLKTITSKNRRRCEWVTDNLVNLINRKNEMFKRYSSHRCNVNLRLEYKNISNLDVKQIRKAKLKFYSKQIENCCGDTKKYWNVVKKIIKSKKPSVQQIRLGDNLIQISDGNEFVVANAFNEYFANAVQQLRSEEFGSNVFPEDNKEYSIFLSEFGLGYSEALECIRMLCKS